MTAISPATRWLPSVSSANVPISYSTYTTASRSLKNMDTDSHVYRRAQQSYALQVSGYKICRMDFFFLIVKTWPWPGQSFCARWRFATCYHGYVCHQERKNNNNNTIVSAIAIHYFGISWIAFRAVCSFFGQFKVTSQRLPMKPLQTSLRMSALL